MCACMCTWVGEAAGWPGGLAQAASVPIALPPSGIAFPKSLTGRPHWSGTI